MKKIIKLLPVALGLIALASCSNDDFLSNGAAEDFSDKYVLTAIEEDDVITTRAYKDVNQANTTYQANEVMRVYDSQMAKYDEFKFNATGKFFTIGAANANITEKNAEGNLDYAYALFGTDGEKLSYAGWNGNNLALVKISDAQTYAENVSSIDGETRVYKENLPQWGTVTSEVQAKTTAARSFTTSLRYLTGRVKVVFENGANNGKPVTNVRVSSYAFKAGQNAAGLLTAMTAKKQKDGYTNDFATDYTTYVTTVGAKPISGWFEAVLDKAKTNDGIRQVSGADNIDAINVAAGLTITESVAGGALDDFTNVFFFPIVPDTYDLLVFEYEDADGWHFIDYLANVTIARGQKVETTDKEDWKAGIDLTVSNDLIVDRDYMQNCEAVSKVMADNTIKEAPVIINLNPNTGSEYVKTIDTDVESQYTIYIPQLKNNMTVNFKTKTILNKKLVIKDVAGANNANYTVKFNFSSIDNTKFDDIEISTTAKELKLEGNFTNLTAAKAVKVLAGNVTVTAAEGATTIPVITKATGEGTSAGTITVDGDATNNLAITTLNAGNATKVTVKGDATHTTISDLNTNACTDVVVNGGTVTNVNLATAAATITVNGNGIANNIKGEQLLNADLIVTVNSADNGIISAFANNTPTLAKPGVYKYNLASKFTSFTNKADAAKTASGEIYTAAQLNSIATWGAAAKLMTTIEIESGNWTSPNLANNFDGNDKAITKLNAPLFGEIAAAVTTITKLNISQANITAAAANCGVLAKVSKATNLAVTASTVAGQISSQYNFVGGLIGQVDATADNVSVKFGTDAAAANAAATVTSNVTLNNTKTYGASDVLDVTAGTWGEFVGSVVNAGTNTAAVKVNFDCAGPTEAHTPVALKYFWKRSANFDANYRVQVLGYLKPTNQDGSVASRQWIGFVGTTLSQIPVLAPADITNVTLTYPMTVNNVIQKVTFPSGATTIGNTNYTFTIDGLGQNDQSGKKTGAAAPYTATIYHNAYTATAYPAAE